jgi:hypothetical protein
MSVEQYLMMCEQMGWEPREEEIPVDPGSLHFDVQNALVLFNILPDRIEGMSGTWLGKDFSCLEVFMNLYEMENRRDVLDFLFIIHNTYDEYYREQQKARENRNKGRR